MVMAGGLAVATAGGFLSGRWWLFDLMSHLRLQLALGGGVVAIAALAAGAPLVAGIACIAALVNTLLVLPQMPGRQPPLTVRSGALRILFANVLEKNHDFERLVSVVDAADADVIVFAEVDADALALVRLRLPRYPYCHERAIGPRPLGMGLLSAEPPLTSRIIPIDDASAPLVLARYAIDGRQLTIIGAHPLPPYRAQWFERRNRYMSILAEVVREEAGDVVVLGDFNITPWAHHYRRFLAESGLHDSRAGFGLQTTWPAFLPRLLRIPIDHCFHTAGVRILTRCILGTTGSDHLPIVVDIALID
jgi:endonuclease/exonuclease/phosphatase (EEP) superfamily protein YafD